jgi:hypothetical protein
VYGIGELSIFQEASTHLRHWRNVFCSWLARLKRGNQVGEINQAGGECVWPALQAKTYAQSLSRRRLWESYEWEGTRASLSAKKAFI